MTLSYDTCRTLKEAGFPQKQPIFIPDGSFDESKGVYIPNLSELIEACGDEFYNLTKSSILTKWYAKVSKKTEVDGQTFSRFIESEGSTPSEAVARLWLALNKK